MIQMDELDRIENLLQTKTFIELTSEEKIWVGQWIASELEYENLRKSETKIKQYFLKSENAVPKPEGLNELKARLNLKQSRSLNWWQAKLPAWSTLLVAICFGVGGWWLTSSSDKVITQPQQLTSVVYDTVYVATKPDTVFVQQVVYKERPVILTKSVQKAATKIVVPSNGINMKEKEELENLLVSGSR